MTTLIARPARTPRKTYRDIKDIAAVPVPAATDSYCPVAQADFWASIQNAFSVYGYRMDNVVHQMHRKRPVFVSVMDVHHDNLPGDSGVTWTVAGMNSYDKSCSARIIFGGRVFVCSNGLIVADHILRTKHTTHVWDRLPDLIAKTVDSFEAEVRVYQKQQDRLKDYTITKTSLAEFTVALAQQEILPKSKMLDFYEEVCSPSFDYKTPSLCLWNLQAAYTHLAKGMNPVERPGAVMSFDRALDGYYSIA